MITIIDVAKHAGVSIGTVSNVLNNLSSVSKANRDKVNKAISELGYRRNNAASQLRSRISRTIGLIIPDIINPFYPAVSCGVDDAAREDGYNVFLSNKNRDTRADDTEAAEDAAIEVMLEKNVDGIIIFKPKVSSKKIYDIQNLCAVVLIDMNPKLVDCDIINVDDYEGMAYSVRVALEGGHRRIGYISGFDGSFSSINRHKAFIDTIKSFGIPERPEYMLEGDFTVESGMKLFKHIVSLPEPPTVIFSSNDQMAKGAIIMAHKMNIKIPDEISVISYDDIYDAKWLYPALTTSWQPKYDLGYRSVKLLLKRIHQRYEQQSCEYEQIVMKTVFKMRDSFREIK